MSVPRAFPPIRNVIDPTTSGHPFPGLLMRQATANGPSPTALEIAAARTACFWCVPPQVTLPCLAGVRQVARRSEPDDGADDLALVQQVERPVDLLERQHLADHLVDLDLPAEVAVYEPRQLRAALYVAERRAAPDAAGDQLERAGMYLFARARDADDGGLPPALVAALERGAHDVDVAAQFEGLVDPTVGHVGDDLLNGLAVVLGVHTIGGAEGLGHREFPGVCVDGDDPSGLGHHGALHHRQPDAPQPAYGDGGARSHLSRVQHRADAGRDAAAKQADLVERRPRIDFRDRDFGQHRVLRECAGAHVVQHGLALGREAGGAVGHEPFALRGADLLAEIGPPRAAELALAAFGCVKRDHVVAGAYARDTGSHLLCGACAVLPENHG